MKRVSKRDTTMINPKWKPIINGEILTGSMASWAAYSSIDAAAKDIVLWMNAIKFKVDEIETLEDHIKAMHGVGYFSGISQQEYFNRTLKLATL